MEQAIVEDEYPYVLECEKYYEIIVKNIGRKWLALGNEVCKDHATYCYEVMDSFYTFESRASYMLYYGKVVNKTFKELLEIMIKIGCRDIAEQLQYLLQHIPIISNHHNVLYKEFTKNIGKQLKRIDQDGGHILIHGGVGSGNISDFQLFLKLNHLLLDLEWGEDNLPDDLETFKKKVQYFHKGIENCNTLFIFDDIRKEHHYEFLDFVKKSIVTSQYSKPQNMDKYEYYKMPEQFTFDNALQVLAQHQNDSNLPKSRQNREISRVIEVCKNHPSAIDIISGLHLRNVKDWQQVASIIDNQAQNNESSTTDFKFHRIFDLSIQQLDKNDRHLFRSLGAFKKLPIPIDSIQSLWKCSQSETVSLLKKFHQKSLLRYREENSYSSSCCILTEVMVDFLQQPLQSDQSISDYNKILNQALIHGYAHRCERKWFTHPDDGYFYQYLIFHVVQAEDVVSLEEIVRDFDWITNKLRSCKLAKELYSDLQKCLDYFYFNGEIEKWFNIQELYQLLNTNAPYLHIKTMDIVQFLLISNRKDNWINKQAMKLAELNGKNQDNDYWKATGWKITGNNNEIKQTDCKWIDRKIIHTGHRSIIDSSNTRDIINCSSPKYGDLRIVHANTIDLKQYSITVRHYLSSKIILEITPANHAIQSTKISANGSLIAYAYADVQISDALGVF
ncbi:uncharacterized protein TRIADDRAFT_60393 [Trichoplax adhaerens]|uniref:APAF-1 helical domain-containing protein n=1 Tax=Trichoplax adhaerens TaxID=10228 RepID=B3S837_TRIAD|nr:predicted protein [Trichoplax adhaerens]EDV21128.1 predicted protein [Trichoplax adhaerens]|eukprot:XP_002116458.1 predicted protein [Trichoplax adhaerens]